MQFKDLYHNLYIGLEMTRQCSMSCFYCHVRRLSHNEPDMDLSEWVDILTPLLRHLKGHAVSMHFAGGEPFLFEGTIPLMKFLNEWCVTTSVVSNGLEVPAEIFSDSMFKGKNGFCFNLSMDGVKEGHEKSRLNFKKISNTFENLIEAGVPTVLRTTAHKKNLSLISDLFIYINNIGKKHHQKIAIDVQPVGGSPSLVIPGFNKFRLELDEYLGTAWDIHLETLSDYPYVEGRWRFLNEMIFSFFPESRNMITANGAMFGCAGGFSFEIRSNGKAARCEMDGTIADLRQSHQEKDIRALFKKLEKLNFPIKKCIMCEYKWSCGMCRLSPVMHGYTAGFGYDDCRRLMRDLEKWHQDHKTAEIVYKLTKGNENER